MTFYEMTQSFGDGAQKSPKETESAADLLRYRSDSTQGNNNKKLQRKLIATSDLHQYWTVAARRSVSTASVVDSPAGVQFLSRSTDLHVPHYESDHGVVPVENAALFG